VTTLSDLQTPCLVLDLGRLRRNVDAMARAVARTGVALRPHMKTAKSAEVARIATSGQAGGITVSTLAEAEHFAAHGFRDILYAVGIVPAKLDRAAALRARGVELMLVTDDADVAEAIAAHPAGLRALVEVDCGEHRAGMPVESDRLLEVGRALGRACAGVMTHAGHSYGCASVADIEDLAEHERATAVRAAQRIAALGLDAGIVSVGSTPTALHARALPGATETRPGVYMFQDLFQTQIWSGARADIAVTVLSSVTGRRPEQGQLILDAGGLALSKDRSTSSARRDYGFGLVLDMHGEPLPGEPVVERANQEHGVVSARAGLDLARYPVGTRLRVAPNHVCMMAAMYDRYHVVDGGEEVVATWDRVNGW